MDIQKFASIFRKVAQQPQVEVSAQPGDLQALIAPQIGFDYNANQFIDQDAFISDVSKAIENVATLPSSINLWIKLQPGTVPAVFTSNVPELAAYFNQKYQAKMARAVGTKRVSEDYDWRLVTGMSFG